MSDPANSTMSSLAVGQSSALGEVSNKRPSGAGHVFQGASNCNVSANTINAAGNNINYTTINNHYNSLPQRPQKYVDDVLAVIPSSDFRKIQVDNINRRTPGTGGELLARPGLQKWMSRNTYDPLIAWGTGGAGTGKTFFNTGVIHRLEERAKTDPGISVAYAYIRYTEKLTVSDILTAFVRQQVERFHNLASVVEPLFAQKKRENSTPSVAELVGLLKKIATYFDVTFYSLDGLDEAPRELHVKIVKTIAEIRVKLLMTSRPVSADRAVPEAYHFTVVAHDTDIRKYIDEQLADNPDLDDLVTAYGREQFIRRIQAQAGGMFLHAALQMGMLRNANSLSDVQRHLDQPPQDLSQIYRNTVDRIKTLPSGGRDAMRALYWLAFVPPARPNRRPFTFADLQYALTFDEETGSFNPKRAISQDLLLSRCCGLVTVGKGKNNVRLVHYTAKEILRPILEAEVERWPQHLILRTCLAHLTDLGFQNFGVSHKVWKLLRTPLTGLAHEEWATLAGKALSSPVEREVVLNFIMKYSAFPALTRSLDTFSPLHTAAIVPGALHYLMQPHSTNLATAPEPWLVLSAINVNERSSNQSTPLMVACEAGCISNVEALLSVQGIDINLLNLREETAWSLAVDSGKPAILQLLYEFQGAPPHWVTPSGYSILSCAVKMGNTEFLESLIKFPGVQANQVDYQGHTPLLYAVQKGDVDCLRVLVNIPGIDADQVDSHGRAPLSYAAQNRDLECVRILLNSPGVQVDRVDSKGRSPLSYAVQKGDVDCLEFLDADQVDSNGRAPLSDAAQNRDLECVRILLNSPGVQVNRVDSKGRSPLSYAAERRMVGCLRLLVNTPGVEADQVDSDGRSPLSYAAERGNLEAVRFLLNTPGVQVDSVDSSGRSPLRYAKESGYSKVERLIKLLGVRNDSDEVDS